MERPAQCTSLRWRLYLRADSFIPSLGFEMTPKLDVVNLLEVGPEPRSVVSLLSFTASGRLRGCRYLLHMGIE